MEEISFFTPINYARPSTYIEDAQSILSNFFYLGGTQATVFANNEVQLVEGEISWYIIAIKVASFILLFPVTVPLFVIHLFWLQYDFSVITLREPDETDCEPIDLIPMPDLNRKFIPGLSSQRESEPVVFSGISIIPPENIIPFSISGSKPNEESIPEPSHQESKPVLPSLSETVTEIETIHSTMISLSEEKVSSFQPFTIKIDNKPVHLSSLEEMKKEIQRLVQQIIGRHIQVTLQILDCPTLDLEQVSREKRAQALLFIEKLKNFVNVQTTDSEGILHINPSKTEEKRDGTLTINKYKNGVIEEVEADGDGLWIGRRIYPDGAVETGFFNFFHFEKGIYIKEGKIIYRMPSTILGSLSLDRHLMYAEIGGKKQLIVVQSTRKNPKDYSSDFIQVNEEFIPTLAKILENEDWISKNVLQEILPGPTDFEQFVKFLFESHAIFSLRPHPLTVLLDMIKEKNITVDLQQEHPDTKERLIDCYADENSVVNALLQIDPTLHKRMERVDIKCVRAFLRGLFYY